MKTGRKILLAVLGLVVVAGLLYIADWLWLGSVARGEVLQAFERRGADSEIESEIYFNGSDANLRLGLPGAFHDFRQAVVVLKYSCETDSIVFAGEDYGEESYVEYDGEGGDGYISEDGVEYADENGAEDGGEYLDESGGESMDESVSGSEENASEDTDPDEAFIEEGAYDEYADGQDGDAETYTAERVTSNVLMTVWLEFINWRWQIVDINFLYE